MNLQEMGVWLLEKSKAGRPLKLWRADLYYCSKCGHELIADIGSFPYLDYKDERLSTFLEKLKSNSEVIFEWRHAN